MRAAGYCRVSSQEQLNGTSLAEQERQIRAYCDLKGLELAAIYVDGAVSGGTQLATRPAGKELTAALNNAEIDCIIVAKLDRAFRSASDCLNNVEQWEKKGVSLHIMNLGGQSIDTSTPTGKFFITVMAGAAELEKNLINERCASGRKARKAEGKRIGEVPFGWNLGADEKTLVENPDEQRALELIRSMNGDGHSLRAIAQELINRGVPSKKGGDWSHKQVGSILRRAA